MDSIRQAIDRARGTVPSLRPDGVDAARRERELKVRSVQLDLEILERNRIVAHSPADGPSRAFDMLRTQVLQEMDKNGWQFLAITSATAGCGKSVISCNLAVGMSRLPERSVLLVDLDLYRPNVSKYLNLKAEHGVISALQGGAPHMSLLVRATFGDHNFLVLPSKSCQEGASELMSSQAMTILLQTIKSEFPSHIVIFDLPPMLVGDDVISILPQMDAVLLIASAGQTSQADILECTKHLEHTPVVRVVLNRATDETESYYGYGYR